MSNLQLGSLVLNAELLAALAAGIMGWLAVRAKLRKRSDRDLSAAWNAIMIWIAVWKGSLLLTDAAGVMRQPFSLLYYDGGLLGFWLACVATAGYLGYRYGRLYGRAEGWTIAAAFASGWASAYLLAGILLDSASVLYVHWLGLFAAIAATVILADVRGTGSKLMGSLRAETNNRRNALLRPMMQVAGAMLLLVLISYTAYGQMERLLDRQATQAAASGTIGAREGNHAPAIELTGLSGDNVSLADYKGKTVLVNFWTTWCRVCMTEMPHVQKLHEGFLEQDEDGDVAILSVNVTSQEGSAKGVRQYADKRELTFPIVLDSRGSAAEAYRVSAYPTTFIIDGDGVIRERFVGAISYADMKKRMNRAQDGQDG